MIELTSIQSKFMQDVLALEPRIAACDCDGTLWSGDAGEGFFSWELDNKLVSEEVIRWARPRYAEYRAGKVSEADMCGEMVTMHRGMREDIVQNACDEFFAKSIAPGIFSEMQELVQRLIGSGCELWAVSSSNQWIIRSAMRTFGIPQDRILATEVAVESGIITDRLIRIPSGPGKAEALRSVLESGLDCAFGNAIWDREMLAMATHAFAVNPNSNLREIAIAQGWTVYQPKLSRET
jgi:phosphoserine phosphatase